MKLKILKRLNHSQNNQPDNVPVDFKNTNLTYTTVTVIVTKSALTSRKSTNQ